MWRALWITHSLCSWLGVCNVIDSFCKAKQISFLLVCVFCASVAAVRSRALTALRTSSFATDVVAKNVFVTE
jgi:hypothetical protein